jgi:hypothetical protein
LQSDADLGQALAALESFAVFGSQPLNRDSDVDAVILEQPIDDCDVAVLNSPSHGVVVVGRRIHTRVLEQQIDDRKVAVHNSPTNGAIVVGRRIDARVLQQSFDDREMAVPSSQSHGVVVVGRRIDALVSQQSLDDRNVAVTSSPSDGAGRIDTLVLQELLDDREVASRSSPSEGVVVVGRRIEHRVSSEQIIDDVDVAVCSGPHKGDVCFSVDLHLARVEHLLQKRQSTKGSVTTECLKFDVARHPLKRHSEFQSSEIGVWSQFAARA